MAPKVGTYSYKFKNVSYKIFALVRSRSNKVGWLTPINYKNIYVTNKYNE